MTNSNLKPWIPGVSGNPKGRPKGARSWSKVASELLTDEQLLAKLTKQGMINDTDLNGCTNAMELITAVQVTKAIKGDFKAAEWLRRVQSDFDAAYVAIEGTPVALVKFIGDSDDSYSKTVNTEHHYAA